MEHQDNLCFARISTAILLNRNNHVLYIVHVPRTTGSSYVNGISCRASFYSSCVTLSCKRCHACIHGGTDLRVFGEPVKRWVMRTTHHIWMLSFLHTDGRRTKSVHETSSKNDGENVILRKMSTAKYLSGLINVRRRRNTIFMRYFLKAALPGWHSEMPVYLLRITSLKKALISRFSGCHVKEKANCKPPAVYSHFVNLGWPSIPWWKNGILGTE